MGCVNSTSVPPATPTIPLPLATAGPVKGAKVLGPPVGTRPNTRLAGIAPSDPASARSGVSKKAASLTAPVRAGSTFQVVTTGNGAKSFGPSLRLPGSDAADPPGSATPTEARLLAIN